MKKQFFSFLSVSVLLVATSPAPIVPDCADCNVAFARETAVSADFNHDSHSSTFALDQTKVMDGTLVRILSWYDNEWGFSTRMSDTAIAMAKLI